MYATTSRAPIRIIDVGGDVQQANLGRRWAQVGRQGNPLFCEGLIAVEDKDRYNRTSPENDSVLFRKYAETPELAALINAVGLQPASDPAITTRRTDLSAIFIPDLIKTDLSTPPARLAGGGPGNSVNPDDAGFSRLSVFGNDLLPSQVQNLGALGRNVPGGWPNGRRFRDEVRVRGDHELRAVRCFCRQAQLFQVRVVRGVNGCRDRRRALRGRSALDGAALASGIIRVDCTSGSNESHDCRSQESQFHFFPFGCLESRAPAERARN